MRGWSRTSVYELTIRSEGSQRAEDILKVDQTDPDGIPFCGTILLQILSYQIPSSVSKDSELPTAGEANPKRRRRIGKAGIKKESREDSEGASIEVVWLSIDKLVLHRIRRMWSPRLLAGLKILRWILEIAPLYESVASTTWFYCTLHLSRTEQFRQVFLPSSYHWSIL